MTATITYKPSYAVNRQFMPEKPLIDLTAEECPLEAEMREADEQGRQ